MILNSITYFILMNPKDKDDVLYVNEEPWIDTNTILTQKNKEWYNIYIILNDFDKKRTEGDLIGFKTIWIDLDMQENTIVGEYNWDYKSILSLCKNKLWFYPTKINKTYKGFHLYFDLDSSLYSMEREQYIKLYKHINKVLGGDPKMKHITGVLKSEGFNDNKGDRKFIITTEYTNDIRISKKQIECILWEEIIEDTKRIEDYEIKVLKKERNTNMFEKIDCLDFINAINNNSYIFNGIKINITWKSIDGTSWLKIYKDESWFHTIKDFSGKNRFWNSKFLYNYVIKELMWIIDFKDIQNKEQIGKIMWWLSSEFWIKYNKGLSEKPIHNTFMEMAIQKNEVTLPKSLHWDIWEKMFKMYDEYLTDSGMKGEVKRCTILLNNYCIDNNLNLNNWIIIKENDLLNAFWYWIDSKNKKHISDTMDFLNWLLFPYTTDDKDIWKARGVVKVFDILRTVSPWLPVVYKIKSNFHPKKMIWINPESMKKIKEPWHFNFLMIVKSSIQEFWSCNLNIKKTLEELNLSEVRGIKRILDKFKEEWYIKEYSIGEITLIIK